MFYFSHLKCKWVILFNSNLVISNFAQTHTHTYTRGEWQFNSVCKLYVFIRSIGVILSKLCNQCLNCLISYRAQILHTIHTLWITMQSRIQMYVFIRSHCVWLYGPNSFSWFYFIKSLLLFFEIVCMLITQGYNQNFYLTINLLFFF